MAMTVSDAATIKKILVLANATTARFYGRFKPKSIIGSRLMCSFCSAIKLNFSSVWLRFICRFIVDLLNTNLIRRFYELCQVTDNNNF